MRHCLCHRLAVLFAALFLISVPALAGTAAHFGPRLLLVRKDGHSAMFLPESHIGSPAQEDGYFRDVIRPAFAASSALLAERSSVSWFERGYDQAACADEGAAEAALDSRLNAALREQAPAVPPPLRSVAASDRLETLGRFIRFHLLFVNAHQRAMGRLPAQADATARRFQVRNAQSGVLLAEAPRRTSSVEDIGTWLDAYCAMTPQQRSALIASTIEQSRQESAAGAGGSAEQLRDSTYRDNDADYQRELGRVRAALQAHAATTDARAWTQDELVLNRFMIVQRSKAWVAGMPAVLAHERLPFYALGAAHFADSPSGPGLITLLRENGYAVHLLADRRALNAALAQLPPARAAERETPLAVRPLAGDCHTDGDSYGCSWSDPTTSYTVLNAQSSQPLEIWSACFQREGMLGPERHCVSSTRQADAQRAADLGASRRRDKPPPAPAEP